jgi:1-acyl-sn-glycerol-3-phosphate acyltransferase
VAVLALRSGAPVVPLTIAGAFQTWPRGRAVPRPGPIRLHFAAPFRAADVRPEGSRAERRRAVTGEIMRRIADGFHDLGRPDLARDSQDAVGAVRKKTRFQ